MADIPGVKKSLKRSLSRAISNPQGHLAPGDVPVPSSIFSDRSRSILEAATTYLKEEKKCTLRHIAHLLHRDERTIWTCYSRAKKKQQKAKAQKHLPSVDIPTSVFHDRRFSSLEAVVVYLKEKRGFSFREISHLLSRDERTIWTCYARTKKKQEKRQVPRAPLARKELSVLPRYEIQSSLLHDRSLSVLEAITEYLKEKEWSFRQIAHFLHRDERTVWTCYSRAKKKRIHVREVPPVPIRTIGIPLDIFRDRRFSSLEGLVVHLKEKLHLSFREISLLLNRDERTIWTCYHRSLKKITSRMQGGGLQ